MPRKLFLRIDRGSIAGTDLSAMMSASQITNVDVPEDCFQYGFDSITLDHALLLLGENKSRFGFDLWHYLHSAHGLFGHIADGFVVMPNGSPDFKRRYSEDLGVAIGSLFLAHTIDLRLETVAQIPTNARLDKHAKVPDFVGFDGTNRKRVYECKGTTAPDDVDKHRQKAKSQLADHHEANVTKFATVTYVPTSSKLIPPFIFVSDPPIPLPRMSRAVVTGLHLVLTLEFSGLQSPVEPLRQMMASWVKLEQTLADGEGMNFRSRSDFQDQQRSFLATLTSAIDLADVIQMEQRRVAGVFRTAENQGRKIKAFTGVDVDHAIAVANALATIEPEATFQIPQYQTEATHTGRQDGTFSRFSDGTILYVYPTA